VFTFNLWETVGFMNHVVKTQQGNICILLEVVSRLQIREAGIERGFGAKN
jgi:hypothetical protein